MHCSISDCTMIKEGVRDFVVICFRNVLSDRHAFWTDRRLNPPLIPRPIFLTALKAVSERSRLNT